MPTDRGRRLRWPATVRGRVTTLATLVVSLVLVATAAALVAQQRAVLSEQLDEALAADADRLTDSLASRPAATELIVTGDDDAVAQLVTPSGEVLASSPNLADTPPLGDAPAGAGDVFVTSGAIGTEDVDYRLLSRRFRAADRRTLVVHVAAPTDDIDETVRALVVSMSVTLPAVTVVLAGLIWVLVGRTLRPVERIRAEVASIGSGGLDRRVPQPPGGDEIARLATTMNAMLDRLEVSMRQQQRFVADASHELRTPLTRIRSELEVALAHPPRAGDAVNADLAALRSLLDDVDALQRLIDDLLVLARAQEADDVEARRPADLDDLLLDEIRSLRPTAVAIDVSRVSGAQVVGNREQLRRIVRNVLDNALRHAATSVTVGLSEGPESITLSVADDGPGIPADRREVIFERFGRVDEARSSSTGGTGLGLAIARDLVERHGGTIAVDADYELGARFVVTLPTPAVL